MCSVLKHFYFLPSISVSTHHKSVSSRSLMLCFSQEALEKNRDKRQVCESLVSERIHQRPAEHGFEEEKEAADCFGVFLF